MTDIKETLFALSRLSGPSGREDPLAQAAADLLRPRCNGVSIDRLGNVIGRINAPKPDAKTVLLDAHLDEIGLIVTAEDKGFYRFAPIGGLDARTLPGAEITLLTPGQATPAVIACLPPHVMKPGDADKSQSMDELFLDTGGASVPAGTFGVLKGEPTTLGAYVSGKSFDDRACFATLLRALDFIRQDELAVNVVVVGSSREETGGQGAAVAAFGLRPDWAAAVDLTFGQAPDTNKTEAFTLGGGVVIDHGPDCNRKTCARLREIARAKEIPYQISVDAGHSGTNATAMQIAAYGIATTVLSIPARYMHSAVETLSIEDCESCAKLLGEWVMSLC